jgi:hypothetical protein
MSFAGKKITAVGHHQADATKRLTMNLQSGFVNKVAAYGSQQPPSSGKVRTNHSKSKGVATS